MGVYRAIEMDLRMTFNQDEVNYDRCRPTYPPALFDTVLQAVGRPASALEIGIGTGQATRPFLEAGYRVTAIDIGRRMADFSRQKYEAFPGFQVFCTSFEDFHPKEPFDLIYAATAFHWIPQEAGYPKALKLLRPDGTLALFWNHPYVNRADDPLHQEIARAYQKYQGTTAASPEFSQKDCAPVLARLQKYGFCHCRSFLFHAVRTLDAQGYIALMNTYSGHRAMAREQKLGLEREIGDAITRRGNRLRIYDTVDLYLAQRPSSHPDKTY